MAKTVLIADVTAFMRLTLSSIMERGGYRVIGEAEDGEKAVEMYRQLTPTLVTLDILLPKLDGISAIKQIKGFDPVANIVVISAMGKKKLVLEALSAGARDFVLKPFQPERVFEALQKIDDGR
ncbi:MAG TPA: response regulator [Bacillota bacterium]|nr:response regulator [Bacillota bacterium]HOB86518.1 response regulator [Bacillota bacterium]HOP68895.1 response regulator [Bacillota bacterium]HPT33402.1 response regulator [Bacillota bacterium]HPZ65413.1 response regulator [Bacillota bacterium]